MSLKKLIAFDLDSTLAPSKSPAPDRISKSLRELLDKYEVSIISGGKFEQFEKQVLAYLNAEPEQLKRLHIMPTCGTRYFKYDPEKGEWLKVYAEDFKEEEKKKIIDALNEGFDELNYREEKIYGENIEDRESQITFSVYGQDVVDVLGAKGVELKENWDADQTKKQALVANISAKIPEFEVKGNGTTSIDVTKKGIDKGYGIAKLMEILDIDMDEILFIGDRLQPGGNDYPVKEMGVDCISIAGWQETAVAIETILKIS